MKIIHLYCHFGEVNEATARRNRIAQESWKELGETERVEVTPKHIKRDGRRIDREFPAWFAKDIINVGFEASNQRDDIIFFSSADCGVMPGIREKVLELVGAHEAVHMRKRNFQVIDQPITDFDEVRKGGDYPGLDTMAFTADWWAWNRPIFPDVLYGRQHWDGAMRNLLRRSGAPLLMDHVWHNEHESLWLSGKTNRANLYNERLLCRWIERYGGSTLDFYYTNEELDYQT